MELIGMPLDQALAELKQRSGMAFTAPRIDANSNVTLRARGMEFDDWTHELARQLNAVPVFHGASKSIEFVPRNELSHMTFSKGAPGAHAEAKFKHYHPGNAIRLLATAAKIDMEVPERFQGTRFDADFPDMPWKDLLEAILEASGGPSRAIVEPNGLVRIVP